jgi:LytR cell envelope-related transcriptional attenuator
MARTTSGKSRREHLKNLRKISKSRVVSKKPAAARSSVAEPSSLFTTVGLLLAVTAIAILAGSAIFQDRTGTFDFVSTDRYTKDQSLPAIDPSTIEVRVLNGCGTPGAGRHMAGRLRGLNFDVVDSGNAENFSYAQTLVIGHSNLVETARAVAGAIGCKQVSSRPDNLAMVDVTVILGQDWQKFLNNPVDNEEPSTWEKLISAAKDILGKK